MTLHFHNVSKSIRKNNNGIPFVVVLMRAKLQLESIK